MGFLADLLFGKEKKPEYLGPGELESTYGQLASMQMPGTGQLQMDIRNYLGQLGGGTLTSAARDYMGQVLGGAGVNPYESQAFEQLRQATLGQTRENLGALSGALGASGLLRGSGAERPDRGRREGCCGPGEEKQDYHGRGKGNRGPSRDRARARYGIHRGRGKRHEDIHCPQGPGGPGLHHADADRGPLPDAQKRAHGQDRRPAGRQGGREADF